MSHLKETPKVPTKAKLSDQFSSQGAVESPSKRRYASISHPQGDSQTVKKVLPNGNYLSNIDVKSTPSMNALKPPHRIPKIDIRQAGSNDQLSPAYNVSQSSPNRADSRLERQKLEQTSQTPMNGGKSKVKKTRQDKTDGSQEPELESGSLHLVPCRWSLTGWKYVKVDPSDQRFFNSPHRINGQGIYTGNTSPQTKQKMLNILGGDSSEIVERRWIGADKMSAEEIGTSYSKFFSPTKLDELKDMQKKRFEYRNNLMKGQEGQFSQFTMPNGSNIQPGVVNHSSSGQQQAPFHQKNFYGQTVNWAGGLHYRSNFNRTRDYIGDWTNVLFRN